MMTLIEGPDGSGKSTIAKLLSSNDQYIIHSKGPVKTKELAEERKFWYRELINSNIIFDRSFFISEYIYGNVFRGNSYIKYDEIIDYIVDIMDAGGIIIFCNRIFNHIEDEDDPHGIEKLATRDQQYVLKLYRELFSDLYKDTELYSYKYYYIL